ncbi:MAG: hypothetical protein CVV49_21905 [Spirochaetae bacterium HGW-Spirochaetae-5]|nr:MAG: hypothetical protein CVV49_21905 [Spirochaetae bacterium HGW-Spirochaetae-5]
MTKNDPFRTLLNQFNAFNSLSKSFPMNSFASEMTKRITALSGLNVNTFTTDMIAKSLASYSFPNNTFVSAMITQSKAFSATSMNSFIPDMVLKSQFSAIQMKPWIPEIAAMSKTFSIVDTKTFYPNMTIMFDTLSALQMKPIFPQIPAITNLIKKSNSLLTTYNDVISLRLGLEIDSGDDNKVISIASGIDEEFTYVKKDKLSLDFYLQIVLALLIFVRSEYSAIKDKDEIIKTIHGTESRIVSEVKKLETDLLIGTHYVIIRQTFGYDYPNSEKAFKKLILYPNQKVRLIDSKGKWIYVEYFNQLTNQHEQAWCKKKYSKIICVN